MREEIDLCRERERAAVEWLHEVGSANGYIIVDGIGNRHCRVLLGMLCRLNAIPPSRSEEQLKEIRELGT
jgi:hypothetical protein